MVKTLFRRPSQLRWGASNSLIILGKREEEEEGEISFLSIGSDLEALESIKNQKRINGESIKRVNRESIKNQ